MTTDLGAQTLAQLPKDQSGEILSLMPIANASMIIRWWPSDLQQAVLGAMPSRAAEGLRRVLSYLPATVGALMDPLAFALPADITVQDARRRVEEAGDKVLYYLYIVDREHKLVGVLNLRDFILASSSALLSSVMSKKVVKLKANTYLEHIIDAADRQKYLSLPVVDDKGMFVGVLSNKSLADFESQADRVQPRKSPVDTAVAFGELYLVALSGLISGIKPAAPRETDPPVAKETSDAS